VSRPKASFATLLALAALASAGVAWARSGSPGLAGVELKDVARQVGLGFRQGAFRYGVSSEPYAMLGGGLCWLDYDDDGWLDLFVVNSYTDHDAAAWKRHGGLPRSALFHSVKGRFTNVTAKAHAGLAVQGDGCVAADLNGDGRTDLLVTTASGLKLLWNAGRGRFTEGARAAGLRAPGWYAGAAVADVNGDGRPDLYVAGYSNPNAPIPGSDSGFPGNLQGVRDLLYVNQGRDRRGHSRFREVGRQAGLEVARFDHSLGAVFSDVNGDGRPDLYVANDTDPNRLYVNVAWPGGRKADPARLGFRFEERGAAEGVADPNAGMGVAAVDYDGDGRPDLFVTNARGQQHAIYRSKAGTPSYADGRPGFATALGTSYAGWGVSFPDLDNDGYPDAVLANGAIPVTDLSRDTEPIQAFENLGPGQPGVFQNVSGLVDRGVPRIIGRGLAAADYDNDGNVDVAINSISGPLVLLRNTNTGGHWLEVALKGFHPGAEVTAVLPDGRKLYREVQAGSSYLSSEDPRVHFGLGDATKVSELTVRFPGGTETRLTDVEADRRIAVAPEPYLIKDCVRADLKGRSVARIWDEALLDAIRRDIPAPTTHARNLFHLSAAMWDAWAAYDPKADGYLVREKDTASDVLAARETAISYAAYHLLVWRYSQAANLKQTFDELRSTMESLCYRPDFTSTQGDSPAALGNRIAAGAIRYGRSDGSLEAQHYVDPSFTPANPPLIVKQPGTTMHDPTFWQPLALDQTIAQNGIAVPGKVQTFIGAQWGRVKSFALPASRKGVPIDPGPPPIGEPTDPRYKQAAVDVIRESSDLDPSDGQMIDVGLDARGNNALGTNDGHGYPVNPVTGKPYASELVPQGDFGRIIAEFWADGPNSETPPGHWNVLANAVSDSPLLAAKIGPGAANRLQWDVKMYFALNGAVHDAAIAAWGLKRAYQSVRPISMIRYLAGQGQSSDPGGPGYSPEGLPLVPGLIEVITPQSSAPGQRHAALAGHVGEIAIHAWNGTGVGWILGTTWVPYQRPTFVTPAFPGFVSGHSTFSRAAAEVLAAYTGSPYFPGGVFTQTFAPGYLKFVSGPSRPVTLEWATYYDAADQAGLSRIFGGIHIAADDFAGRRLGSRIGKAAYALAERYFDGTAR
jgi:hypothetical protein